MKIYKANENLADNHAPFTNFHFNEVQLSNKHGIDRFAHELPKDVRLK